MPVMGRWYQLRDFLCIIEEGGRRLLSSISGCEDVGGHLYWADTGQGGPKQFEIWGVPPR